MEYVSNTYKVPAQNLDKLRTQMDKLIRRCNRLKIQAPQIIIGEPFEESYEHVEYDADTLSVERSTRFKTFYPVVLESFGRPKINGYEFAATLAPEFGEDGNLIGNVLRKVPTFQGDIPDRFRSAGNYCDHCKTDRRRLETFVIASEEHGFRQIGRNCLAGYLGLQDPEKYAEFAEIIVEASDLMGMSEDEGFGGGSGQSPRYLMSEVLEIAASAIRQYGWLSRASAQKFDKQSTSSRVSSWMFGGKKTREAFEFPLKVNDDDKALVVETMEWLKTIDTNTTDDYMYNLSLLSRSVSLASKNFGIAISSINAYSREKERQIRRNARIEEDKNSKHLGVVGERMTFDNALVLYTTTFDGDFGVSHMYKMKQGDDIIIYFSSNDLEWKQGEVAPAFTARIKAHEVREEINQTKITRATILPTEEEKAALAARKAEEKAAKKQAKADEKLFKTIAWG